MDQLRLAPTVGIVGSLLYLASLAVPYFLVESQGAVGAYYDAGTLTPLIPAVLALVTLIVVAAGREGRSDPGLAAGAGIVLGLFMVVLTLLWALTVPESLVLGLTEQTVMQYHRWVAVAVAVPVPLGAVWFARALDLL